MLNLNNFYTKSNFQFQQKFSRINTLFTKFQKKAINAEVQKIKREPWPFSTIKKRGTT